MTSEQSYTHVFLFKQNDTVRPNTIPRLGDNHHLLFVQINEDGPEEVRYISGKDSVKKDQAIAKRKGSTVLQTGQEFDFNEDFDEIKNSKFVFHNCPNIDYQKKYFSNAIKIMMTAEDQKEADLTMFEEVEDLAKAGRILTPQIGNDGSLLAVVETDVTAPRTTDPPAPTREEEKEDREDQETPPAAAGTVPGPTGENLDNFAYDPNYDVSGNPETTNEIVKSIIILDHATKYVGFSAKKIRQTFLDSCTSPNSYTRDLVLLLMGFVRISNNIGKIQKKRENIVQAKKIQELYSDKKIKMRASAADEITLPRLAIAFMPELLMVRTHLVSDLQNQFETGLEVRFADIQFAGSPDIYGRAGYAEFHRQMSAAIHRVGGNKATRSEADKFGVDPKDEKFDKNLKRWLKVSQDGFAKEQPVVKERLRNAISFVAPASNVRKAAFEWIRGGYTEYRNAL